MRHILILISILLISSPLFGQSKEKPCYVSVTSSDEFNLILLSNISTSLISQYIREVKPIPSSGISGQNHCIYEVSVTKDEEKTFVTLQGKDLNSFGDSSLEGTDGFQQSILRSIYEGQELKSRQTVLLTVEQKQIIERRRGAGRLGSVDSSTFVREWLVRSGMFDTVKNPVLENPLDNLNNSFK